MPELPEVEHFRQLLLALVSSTEPLLVTAKMDLAPRKFLSASQVESLNNRYHVSNVIRHGKLICMELDGSKPQVETCKQKQYLCLHMGMTGRISTPGDILKLESLSDKDRYPPPWTCLEFQCGSERACFSDPRKFGSVTLSDEFQVDTAPDALDVSLTCPQNIVDDLSNQSTSIKTILMDQKRVMSGIGNWVADEICFQCELHPQQSFLTTTESKSLLDKLHIILTTAIDCLQSSREYPKEWLFHYRWNKKRQAKVKDSQNRAISFIKLGGRTTAIVPSIQKLAKRSKRNMTREPLANAKKKSSKKRKPVAKESDSVSIQKLRRSTRLETST